MTYLVDRDFYNGSPRDARINFVMFSMLASCWWLLVYIVRIVS